MIPEPTPAPAAPEPGSTPPAEPPPGSTPPPAEPQSTPTPGSTPPAAPEPGSTPPANTLPPIGPDGKLADNWYLSLGDEFAPHAKDLAKHKDIRSILKELDYFRKSGIEYPGEDADEKAVARFRQVAKVPESPDGYGLTAENAKLPAGVQFDGELAGAIAQAAHKLHAPPAVVAGLAETFNGIIAGRVAEAQKAEVKARTEARDDLAKEWGGDYDNNASTVRHLASKLAETAGIPYDSPRISELANMPEFSRIMMQVNKLISEDRTSTPHGFGDYKSPNEKIADIKSGKDPVWGPKYNSRNEQDKLAAYEHIKQLMAQRKE